MGHELLRGRIRKGKADLLQLLTMRQWLAACVMAGAILEALFYLALTKNGHGLNRARFTAAIVYGGTTARRKYLRSFHLMDFARVAEQIGLIGERTVHAIQAVHNSRCFLHASKVYREEKDCDDRQRKMTEINPGIYCYRSDFLKDGLPRLKNNNRQKEYYLTDMVGLAVAQGKKISSSKVRDPIEVLIIQCI